MWEFKSKNDFLFSRVITQLLIFVVVVEQRFDLEEWDTRKKGIEERKVECTPILKVKRANCSLINILSPEFLHKIIIKHRAAFRVNYYLRTIIVIFLCSPWTQIWSRDSRDNFLLSSSVCLITMIKFYAAQWNEWKKGTLTSCPVNFFSFIVFPVAPLKNICGNFPQLLSACVLHFVSFVATVRMFISYVKLWRLFKRALTRLITKSEHQMWKCYSTTLPNFTTSLFSWSFVICSKMLKMSKVLKLLVDHLSSTKWMNCHNEDWESVIRLFNE